MPISSYTAILEKEGDLYVALCPELDVASQPRGDSGRRRWRLARSGATKAAAVQRPMQTRWCEG